MRLRQIVFGSVRAFYYYLGDTDGAARTEVLLSDSLNQKQYAIVIRHH